MQKKVMALAVAGALAAPAAAFAQASNVQIYGRVNAGVDNYEAKGASAASGTTAADMKSRMRVFDNGSRLGVRGTEDLGNGLKAIFVIESGVNIDSGNALTQAGSANSSAGTFATRDSYVGLEGGWGRVTIGRQAEFYGNGVIEQAGTNYINLSLPMFTGTLSRFNGPTTRTNNVVAYTSPTMAGFNGTAWWAPVSEATQAPAAGQTTIADTNAKLYGFTLRYSGIINAQVDWAKFKKANNASGFNNGVPIIPGGQLVGNAAPAAVAATGTAGDNTGLKLGVGWPYMPGAQISVIYINVKQEQNVASTGLNNAGDSLQQKGWGVAWEHVFGNIQALAQFTKTNKITGCTETVPGAGIVTGVTGTTCSDTQATGVLLGGRYLLSKRTSAYVTYAKITNKANSGQDFQPAGYSATQGANVANGADPRVWAVGLQHNF